MKSSNKILATVLATAIAASTISVPAFAHNPQNHQGPGIVPLIAGPIGAGALAGTSTTTFSWFTTQSVFSHFQWNFTGFKPVFAGFKHVPSGFKWVKVSHKWIKVPTFKKVPIFKKVPTFNKVAKYKDVKVKHTSSSKSRANMGKAVIGCLVGSAFGAISSSVRKASAMGNPPRWRSQAEHERIVASGYEKQFELTNDEAQTAVALCGLGSLTLHWPQQ